jgi:hypothetical protein
LTDGRQSGTSAAMKGGRVTITDDVGIHTDKAVNLLAAYYGTVRQEILQRTAARESTTTLFLGASAAISSVALGLDERARWLLFIIPVLGLGVSCIYLQHTVAMRAFWLYLAIEYQAEVARALDTTDPPKHWDVSDARHKTGMRASAGMRAVSAFLLLIVPEVLATVVGAITIPPTTALAVAVSGGCVAIVLTVVFVIYAFAQRASSQRLPTSLGSPARETP